MCRFFIYCSNDFNTASNILADVKPFVNCWENATKDDQNFFQYLKVNQHDDGWGSFQYYNSENNKEHFSVHKSSEPAFKDKHSYTINSNTIKNYILLNHARKASPSMPITLNQNHPYVNESGTLILAHNGTLNKDILLSLLNNKPTSIEDLSDTEILNLLLKEKFDKNSEIDCKILLRDWKILISEIKEIHIQKNISYSMNLIFLLKNTSTNSFYVFYSSVYANIAGKKYLDFYTGNYDNKFLISSSTIIDFYNKDYSGNAKKWNLKVLPNNSIGIINLYNKEKLEELI